MNRKLYNVLKDRNVYFELMYSPAIRDSTSRKNIIHMSHLYHAYGKSKNIIISSSAAEAFQVRSPYDVINLYPFESKIMVITFYVCLFLYLKKTEV